MTMSCPLGLLGELSESPVWPEIPEGADVLHIGMAPGREELGRKPFVGPSGRLLRGWLDGAGLLERSAFANVEQHRTRDLKCRSCGFLIWDTPKLQRVELKLAEHLAGRGKDLTKTERAYYERSASYLECGLAGHQWREVNANREPRDPKTGECCGLQLIWRLLSSRQWNAVLFWGAVPARTIGGYKGPVGAMVGRFRTLRLGTPGDERGIPVTVLYHPAFALRQRGTAAFAGTESLEKEILRQVRDRLDHPDSGTSYEYTEVTVGHPLRGFRTVVDIETIVHGKDPDPRVDTPSTLCLGDLDTRDVTLRGLEPGARLDIAPGTRLVMHHAQHDLPLLARMAGHFDITADDTMVMAYLLGRPFLALKILGRRELGLNTREFLEKRGDHDPEYDAQDVHLTRDLYHHFRPQLETKGVRFLYDEVKTPLQSIMARHVVHGLRLDQDRIRALHQKMEARRGLMLERLQAMAGRDFNPNSPEQAAHVIFDVLGIPPDRKAGRTTNETHIGQFRQYPFVSTLLAYRKANSFLSRYTIPLSQLERVSGLYDLTGTGTDRVSQANRNCMNWPGLVKQCAEADEGGFFTYGDFSQIELRLAAYFSRDPYLLGVLREGRNMHEEMCLAVYGARTPETYTQAKSSNFARLFGAGRKRRARTLKMPESVVARLEIPWPGWDAWVAARQHEPARTFWGYERNLDDALESSDERLRDKALRQVINSIIQGTAGEINQYAQVLVDRTLKQFGGFVIHQEHDSVLGWVPGELENARYRAEVEAAHGAAMKAAVPQDILDVIEVKAKVTSGSHWG